MRPPFLSVLEADGEQVGRACPPTPNPTPAPGFWEGPSALTTLVSTLSQIKLLRLHFLLSLLYLDFFLLIQGKEEGGGGEEGV